MLARIFVYRLGPYVSEGSRLLWLAMGRNGLSQERTRSELGVSKGMVGRWLRGDQRPGGRARGLLHDRWRIKPSLWDVPPRKPFSLEAA